MIPEAVIPEAVMRGTVLRAVLGVVAAWAALGVVGTRAVLRSVVAAVEVRRGAT